MKPVFSSVELSFFIHSTEDADRLCSLVCDAVGLNESEIVRENLEGYFGNHLISAKSHIVGHRANNLADRIWKKMEASSKIKFLNELEKSVDEHDTLYLRLDRQSLKDFISLSDDEPVHVKLKPSFREDRNSMIRAYRELVK